MPRRLTRKVPVDEFPAEFFVKHPSTDDAIVAVRTATDFPVVPRQYIGHYVLASVGAIEAEPKYTAIHTIRSIHEEY